MTEGKVKAESISQQHQRAQDAIDALGLNFVAVPTDQLADIYRRFKRLVRMGQATIAEWQSMPKEIAELRHEIFGQADFGAVFAAQWLPKTLREQVFEEMKGASS